MGGEVEGEAERGLEHGSGLESLRETADVSVSMCLLFSSS